MTLVGEDETDTKPQAGSASNRRSPGRSAARRSGDVRTVRLPSGTKDYEVIAIA